MVVRKIEGYNTCNGKACGARAVSAKLLIYYRIEELCLIFGEKSNNNLSLQTHGVIYALF